MFSNGIVEYVFSYFTDYKAKCTVEKFEIMRIIKDTFVAHISFDKNQRIRLLSGPRNGLCVVIYYTHAFNKSQFIVT